MKKSNFTVLLRNPGVGSTESNGEKEKPNFLKKRSGLKKTILDEEIVKIDPNCKKIFSYKISDATGKKNN